MLNRLMSCGAVLMLLAVAAPSTAQQTTSDRDLRNRQNGVGLSTEDRKRYDDLKEEDANYDAAVVAEVELRRKLLRLPPLPDERNVLLGSWRQENGGQRGMLGLEARNGDDMVRELWEALQSNPDKLLPSRCVATFGNGVTFAPSTYTSSALDGSRPGGSIAYRSGGKQVIWVIPDNLKPMPFKIVGPDRILLGIDGSCALVRVGAPAANAAANATTAPGNARAAASGPSSPPAGAATPTAAAGRAREPIEPTSRLGRGVQLHGEKDFQPALQELLVAAQSDPNDPRVYVYLADTYAWLGMDREANQAAERAKQLDPNAFDILR
jgi:tetratricopeptide (TPR) repeat protein